MKTTKGLAVGDRAPETTELLDACSGKTIAPADLRGERDAIVVFLRGTWCPFCRQQMRVLRDGFAALASAGTAVIAVVCQSAPSVQRYVADNPLPFPLLIDDRRALARAYGVHYWLSYDGFNLAHPALFVLDRRGTVTFRHVGKTMADLPVDRVLQRFIDFVAAPAEG